MAKKPHSNRTRSAEVPELLSSEQSPAATPEPSEGNIETIKQPIAKTAKISGLRPPIDAGIREAIAERLRDNTLETHTDIASELGVSHDLVGQISRRMNAGDDDLGYRRQRSLQRQIGKCLTVKQRAMVVASVALGTAAPKAAFAQLSAVKLANDWDNVVTAKDQREIADNAGLALPMFVLKDADVDIGVAIKVRKRG